MTPWDSDWAGGTEGGREHRLPEKNTWKDLQTSENLQDLAGSSTEHENTETKSNKTSKKKSVVAYFGVMEASYPEVLPLCQKMLGGSDIRIAKEYSLDVRKINDAKEGMAVIRRMSWVEVWLTVKKHKMRLWWIINRRKKGHVHHVWPINRQNQCVHQPLKSAWTGHLCGLLRRLPMKSSRWRGQSRPFRSTSCVWVLSLGHVLRKQTP